MTQLTSSHRSMPERPAPGRSPAPRPSGVVSSSTTAMPAARPAAPATRVVAAISRAWDRAVIGVHRFWFTRVTPTNLGIGRFLFFLIVLVLLARHASVAVWADVPGSYWSPMWLFKHLHLPQPSTEAISILLPTWRVSLVLACVGLFTRPAIAVAMVLGVYLLGLQGNFGKSAHGEGVLIFMMLVLMLSRCGDGFSLDALLASRRGRPRLRRRKSGEYCWPIKMAWALLALVFVSAGLTKLKRSGLAWVTSDHLAIILLSHNYTLRAPPTRIGLWIAQRAWRCHILAGFSLLTEVGFPLVLVNRYLRIFFVVSAMLMQIGIALALGIYFTSFLCLYLFFVPWDRVGTGLRVVLGRVASTFGFAGRPDRAVLPTRG